MAGPLGHGAPMPQEMYGYDELGSTLTHPSQPIPSGNDYGLHAVPRHLQPGYVPSNQDPQAGWQNFHYGPNPHEVYDGQIPHAEVAQQPMGQAQPQANVIDDQVLLLHLAESYLGLARQYASDRTSNRQTLDLKHYYKLIAFSLACLRSVMLKSSRWHLHPHREAMVRLKYANILYEETENNTEAEEALTKGIIICERNKYIDLKHAMQYLLCRVLFKQNREAGLKLLDRTIEEMVAYQHVTWLYACRFLRVSMDLEMSSTHGFNRVLQSLNGIVKMAKERHDDSILLITSTMQAHIRLLSGGQDAMEQAQRHLATAQSLQLSAAASRLPQLIAFIRVLDLTCSILGSDVRQTKSKMRESLLQLEQMLNSPEWSDDGIIHLPLNPGPTPPATFSCTGAVSSGAYGPNILTLSWLSKHDMRMLVYYLCGVAATPANPAEMDQAEQFFTQALQLEHAENTNLPHSLSSIDTSHEWRRTLGAYIKIHLALLLCSRTQWKRASGIMEELTTHQNHGLPPTEPLTTLTRYLEGVISQGLGDTSTALRSFTLSIFNPHLDFCQAPTTSTQRIQRDLTILATLNRILIERSIPGNESKITSLINTIEPLCMAINSNKHLRSALSFIKVCSQGTQLSVIETKKHLEEALTMARDLSNTQLVSLSMSFLNWKFLRGMVGPQAEKGARAAVMTATNAGNQLWVSVSKGTLAESLELQGKVDEAKTVKEEAVELARICTPGFF